MTKCRYRIQQAGQKTSLSRNLVPPWRHSTWIKSSILDGELEDSKMVFMIVVTVKG